ncbi:MAG TPA: ROK family protein [Candidatus Lumbricidophila sp.]|nr:ROK family protein [Candidatus Lumbricidophila sp.]
MAHAIGIDIGGTGIKGALVDVASGELLTERLKLATPAGAKPQDVLDTTAELLTQIQDAAGTDLSALPLGVCFPAIVKNGKTLSAANISDEWIGLEAEQLFEERLGRDIHFVNDADAAGVAEARYGAARGVSGLVLLTTLGTGIGGAILWNGELVPNAELGHLEIDGKDAETRAAYSAMERENLTWKQWAKRLQKYYDKLEFLFSPDLIIVGGGVSKHSDEFLPLLNLRTPIVPAVFENAAGVIGAASLAVKSTARHAA